MEPVSTTTALALGAGWFANKVLGPSADELGTQLKAFVGERTRKFVSGAQAKADPEKAKPLTPAFFYNFSQKAAFSEDSDEINEMWSSLLADASEGQSYRHSIFADILTRFGSHEAKYLSWLCSDYNAESSEYVDRNYIELVLDLALRGVDEDIVGASNFSKKILEKFDKVKFNWPVKFEYSRFVSGTNRAEAFSAGVTTISESESLDFAIEVLKREDLIEPFEILLAFRWGEARFEGFKLTKIGAEFYTACSKGDKT